MTEWTECKNEMPDDGVYVRIHPPYEHWNSQPIHCAKIMTYKHGTEWYYVQDSSSYNCHNVTHWKPITEPTT